MDRLERIEALIDGATADAVDRARVLLEQFKGKSETIAQAVDEFLLDLMTLVFVTEAIGGNLHSPARRLARARLGRLRLLLAEAA